MAVDPSISLGVKTPDPTNYISSFVDLGKKQLDLQKARDTYDASVAGIKAVSSSAQSKAEVDAANVQPLIQQQAANTGMAQFQLSGAQAAQGRQLASGLVSDPDFIKGNSAGMVEKLNDAQAAMTSQFGIDPKTADAIVTTLKYQAIHNPGQVRQSLINMTQQGQAPSGQQAAAFPAPAAIASDTGTKFVATGNPELTGVPAGTPGAAPAITPPNQVGTDTSGGSTIVNPARGTATPIASTGGAQPMTFPKGETRDTQAQLQAERTAAQQTANNAGQMHDINRSIVAEVDKGITTGTLGQLKQKVASATGFNLGAETGTDYNVLGKMLERSALQAAQGMGPHTNAGLEAQVRANGSTDYTPQAIRKIANLNDAIVTGSTMYQAGLEGAIANSPNGVFAKRQFDRDWASAMNPTDGVNGVQALRFKNAVDNNDAKGRMEVLAEVGGLGSPGAKALIAKLGALRQMSGQ